MTRFRTKLLVALIALTVGVMIGLGFLLGQLFKSYFLQNFDERLSKDTSLLTTYIEDNGGMASLDKKKMADLSDMLDVRVTVIDMKGTVLSDTGHDQDTNISRHQEIIKKIMKTTTKQKGQIEENRDNVLHYYWKPLKVNNEKSGYVIISTKLDELTDAYKKIWWLLAISLSIALVVIIMLGTRIMARYTKPIEAATNVAIELAKGNYRARTYENHIDETGMLSSSINVLARNLQEMVKAQEMQQDRLETLIENMGSGIMLIDSRGYINLINRPYKEIFHVNPLDYLNRLYYEVIKFKEVNDLIEEIFMTEHKINRQIVLPLEIERRYFEVYGVPIIGTNDVWKGILLVFHDITELKMLEQMRKDFVANVSHELKTPITSIKGFSETLLDGAMGNKQTLESFLKIILTESDRLQSLIQELLDLSKMEQQGFKISIQPFNLIATAREALEILQGKSLEKQIELKLEAENEVLMIDGDIYRIKQVFINLINNAIAYTPVGGHIIVTIQDQANQVVIKVKDSGIGIEKAEIPRIFERFYRVDKDRSRNSGGTGLGLAIVKHIIEAHQGNISVTSEVEKGTTFTILLKKRLSI